MSVLLTDSNTVAAGPPVPAIDPRTRRLLDAPILPTLLRLAAPNIALMLVQAMMSVIDGFYVGRLGPDALAGVSLVFPLMMLMTTMSAGGMGGGISSAIARSLGAGRRERADALAGHALLVGLALAASFSLAALWGGRSLYSAMGGTGAALEAALAYSNVVFGGAVALWLLNSLASILRGSGQMLVPSAVIVGGELIHVALAPALVFGWGPFPRLGVAGAGLSLVTALSLRVLVLGGYFLSGRSLVRPRLVGLRLKRVLFGELLQVGGPGMLNNVLTNLNVMLLTGLVGPFGTFALAGYGLGARLEYLQIPLVFGLGAALVTMVGTNTGAGRHARAERVAWVGAALAGGLTGAIGLLAALFPEVWLRLFSSEPEVLSVGAAYLRTVAPTYGFFGAGLALYFASQGAGRLLWPLVAAFVRLALAVSGGWASIHWLGADLPGLFGAIALAIVAYGCTTLLAVRGGAWRPAGRPASVAATP